MAGKRKTKTNEDGTKTVEVGPIEAGEIPTEFIEAGFDGDAVYRDKSGNPFWLREVPPDEVDRGNTHQLKNKTHFWEGNEENFRLLFTKD